jgi:hypothetical protein
MVNYGTWLLVPELVEDGNVGVHVVDVVYVGWILLLVPEVGGVHLLVQHGVLLLNNYTQLNSFQVTRYLQLPLVAD